MRKTATVLGTLVLLLCASMLVPTPVTQAEPVQVSFPSLMTVKGTVGVSGGSIKIDGPIEQTTFGQFLGEILPVRTIYEALRQKPIGKLHAAGRSKVLIGFDGELRGNLTSPAKLGVLLLPSGVASVRSAADEIQALHFPLLFETTLSPQAHSWFASQPTEAELLFPVYDVYLFNHSKLAANLNVYFSLRQ
jgi:hypothetical protein